MPKSVDRSPFERAVQAGLTVGDNSSANSNSERKALGRRPDSAGDWAPSFIGALMEGSSVRQAAKDAGVDVTMPFKRRVHDEEFRRAWQEAADIGTELLEQEAARRAYHGTLKPVFHKGIECGYVREHSDTLMIFLLKARRPEKYREGVEEGSRAVTTLNVNIVNVEGGSAAVPLEVLPQEDQGEAMLGRLEVVPSGHTEGG